LLILAFPRLRILWSRSPHATVDIFKALKAGREDPSVEQAIALGNKSYLGGPVDEDDDGTDAAVEEEVNTGLSISMWKFLSILL